MVYSVGGLHKQMRGTRAVTLQTRPLFYRLANNFKHELDHPGWTEEERQQPDYRSKLRGKAKALARKPGISF